MTLSVRSFAGPIRRAFSSSHQHVPPTPKLTYPMAVGVMNCTQFYLTHGMSNSILKSISKDASPSGEINTSTLVPRWQKMMESFFGCQVHVLAGVGYHPSEKGLQEYNMQLAQLMGEANPREQEELRVLSRDVWRKSLATAFNVGWEGDEKELDLIFARELMHKIGSRMNDSAFLSLIADASKKHSSENPSPADSSDQQQVLLDLKNKHTLVQEYLINNVYLGGDETILDMSNFGNTEGGYIKLQMAMAQHQNDPLIAQYLGSGMQKVMEAAGLNAQQ